MHIYHDSDVSFDVLDGKKIAVLGYGAQGRAQALCFHDSGLDVTVGVRKDGKSWNRAKEDGLKVAEIPEAVKGADVVMMLLPDEVQPDIYKDYVAPNLKKGAALEFAHGFAITFKLIQPPKDVDVIMMAPKAPGDMERLVFLEGFGVPALVCVHQDYTGNAKKVASLIMSKDESMLAKKYVKKMYQTYLDSVDTAVAEAVTFADSIGGQESVSAIIKKNFYGVN